MKKAIGFILYPIATILNSIVVFMAMIYTFIRLHNLSKINTYLFKVDEIIDKGGNIKAQYLFNDTLIKSNGYFFGTEGDTISHVLAVNKEMNTLTRLGTIISVILIKIKDPAFTKTN